MRQEITICGLDTQVFKQAVANCQDICTLFDREFGEGVLDDGHILKAFNGTPDSAIEVSNRFMMPLKDVGEGLVAVPFGRGVDPKGFLTIAVAGGEFIHTEENSVSYYKCVRDANKGFR